MSGTGKHLLVALTNAVEGREDEFNDWYSNRHLDDILALPGVMAARRYVLSQSQTRPPPYPYRYCAVYEIETDNLEALQQELSARARTPKMPMSDSMSPDSLVLYYSFVCEREAGASPSAAR